MLILIERMFAGGFSGATTAIRAAAAPSVISGLHGVQTSATVCVTKGSFRSYPAPASDGE
jgi:hypothetical protein